MIQTIIALIIGVVAVLYVANKFINQFKKVETDPKCDNCPIPDLRGNSQNKITK